MPPMGAGRCSTCATTATTGWSNRRLPYSAHAARWACGRRSTAYVRRCGARRRRCMQIRSSTGRDSAAMSSGPFTQALSTAAGFVLRSLMERPDLDRPEVIADAPAAGDEIDADAAREGLRELASRDLAT